MKDDRLYLIHILECIRRIEEYVADDQDRFFQSTLVQDGVLRNLQTLAESAQRLSETIKKNYPEVDWRGLSGLRNILVHDYLGVNLREVWQLLATRLPPLKDTIQRILGDLEGTHS